MFWSSVVGGLKVLLFWETYAAAIGYFILFWIPVIIVAAIFDAREELTLSFPVTSLIVVPFFHVLATYFFITTLSPILLGIGNDASWGLPALALTKAPFAVLKVIALVLAISYIISWLIGGGQAFQTTLIGSILLIAMHRGMAVNFPETTMTYGSLVSVK